MEKNVTLDARLGTLALDMEPSTLDPRQKDRLHFASLGVPGIAAGAAFLIIRLLFLSPFKSQETLNVS